jgi:hypothetical protein
LIDIVMVMTVEPGFGGQQFMASLHAALPRAARSSASTGAGSVHVDGGLNRRRRRLRALGVDVLVVGSALGRAGDLAAEVRAIRQVALAATATQTAGATRSAPTAATAGRPTLPSIPTDARRPAASTDAGPVAARHTRRGPRRCRSCWRHREGLLSCSRGPDDTDAVGAGSPDHGVADISRYRRSRTSLIDAAARRWSSTTTPSRTLAAAAGRGSRAASLELAQRLYERFCADLEALGQRVARGRFGAETAVEPVNDGPSPSGSTAHSARAASEQACPDSARGQKIPQACAHRARLAA